MINNIYIYPWWMISMILVWSMCVNYGKVWLKGQNYLHRTGVGLATVLVNARVRNFRKTIIYIIILPYFTGNICHDHYIYQIPHSVRQHLQKDNICEHIVLPWFSTEIRRSTWIVEQMGFFQCHFSFIVGVFITSIFPSQITQIH